MQRVSGDVASTVVQEDLTPVGRQGDCIHGALFGTLLPSAMCPVLVPSGCRMLHPERRLCSKGMAWNVLGMVPGCAICSCMLMHGVVAPHIATAIEAQRTCECALHDVAGTAFPLSILDNSVCQSDLMT